MTARKIRGQPRPHWPGAIMRSFELFQSDTDSLYRAPLQMTHETVPFSRERKAQLALANAIGRFDAENGNPGTPEPFEAMH